MSVTRKVQLVLLFGGSLLPAGTTMYRLPHIIDRHGSQQYRSLMASVEILFATAVANALVLGSFIRDKGVKKQRWKLGSISDSIERMPSRRGPAMRHWGSDEDLVRDLGLGVDPELRSARPAPRPAPMATAGNVPVKAHKSRDMKDWQFHGAGRSEASDEIVLMKMAHGGLGPDEISPVHSPQKVSFFDVGGLLDDDQPRTTSSDRITDTDGESSIQLPQHEHGLSPTPARRGSAALLYDLGGFLSPRKERTPQQPRSYELQTMQQQPQGGRRGSASPAKPERQPTRLSLQDVGGLLSGFSPQSQSQSQSLQPRE
ncbi:uncharacterized protein BP5553_06471 [Venustampulla echinocandica]|uniref:Uncharacterized protein n=1 Tax=Venustampulla echinocandica TaxID=2656787 RepID=A0A370TK12_9HELO|nr:uncharacterized protein BP5553_06471 [Venustampulla echinocandica]RDL35859.1 hypothetical protein BP5553_06471 [Venustampulla echinocandica]